MLNWPPGSFTSFTEHYQIITSKCNLISWGVGQWKVLRLHVKKMDVGNDTQVINGNGNKYCSYTLIMYTQCSLAA